MSFRSEHVATYTGDTFLWENRQEFRRESPNGAFVVSFLYRSSGISQHYKDHIDFHRITETGIYI